MDRRTFLATSVAGVTLPLVGCLGGDAEVATETPTGSTEAARPHDLYVVNYTTTTAIASVRVVDSADSVVVDGRYELPSERGIEFADIGAWGTTYAIELTIDGVALESVTWETASCEAIDEAPRGSRDGHVRVRDDGSDGLRATIAVDDCDAIIKPEYPTGPAQGFRVE